MCVLRFRQVVLDVGSVSARILRQHNRISPYCDHHLLRMSEKTRELQSDLVITRGVIYIHVGLTHSQQTYDEFVIMSVLLIYKL